MAWSMQSRRGRARVLGAAAAVSMGLVSTLVGAVAASPASANSTASATVNGNTTYQRISGFGSSEAFLQAVFIMNAPRSTQNEVLQLLYSTKKGAGLTILRNMVGSISEYNTIEPTAPSSPSSPPTYRALGTDAGQEWLASTIEHKYGVSQFFADAWSAPPFMKTNDSDNGGGTLCGVPGATCASGDWQ
jgi:O-glycosyl hydrolase